MRNQIIQGDCLEVLRTMPSNHVQTVVTSPPYFNLRDYGIDGQIGLEESPEAYIAKLVEVFREVKRVLKDDGLLWLNIGDSYTGNGRIDPYRTTSSGKIMPPQGRAPITEGLKPKDLIGIPWMLAFALRADSYYLRADCIWHKPNCMPESVKDRPTKSHEYLFLLSKSDRYYYDTDIIREPHTDITSILRHKDTGRGNQAYALASGLNHHPQRNSNSGLGGHELGRNKRSVWSINTQPYPEAHFAVMPEKLVEPCILAGSRPNDIVLDPFSGAGTVAYVASKLGRAYLGIELNPQYVEMSKRRLMQLSLVEVA